MLCNIKYVPIINQNTYKLSSSVMYKWPSQVHQLHRLRVGTICVIYQFTSLCLTSVFSITVAYIYTVHTQKKTIFWKLLHVSYNFHPLCHFFFPIFMTFFLQKCNSILWSSLISLKMPIRLYPLLAAFNLLLVFFLPCNFYDTKKLTL